MSIDHAATVRILLAAAGVTPSPEEVERLIAARPGTVAALEALHAVEEARYEEPSVVHHALI